MDTSSVRRPSALRRLAPLLVLSLVVSAGAAGCAGGEDHQATPAAEAAASHAAATPSHGASSAPAAGDTGAVGGDTGAVGGVDPVVMAEVPMGSMVMPTQEEVTAAWSSRPAYVTALPGDWQSAYAFALARPDVLQWLPCYCGCDGAGHRSNLDCFFQRRETGTIAFEEHGSYCDICVDTANLAAKMLRDGNTMMEIRDAVDTTFSGRAPGTVTPLPPA